MVMPRTPKVPSAPKVASEREELNGLPEPLRPRESENDRAYAAFLLWCLSEPSERSKRLIGSALNCGDANVRMWASKYAWDRRLVQVPDAEWHALRGYRALMDLQPGSAKVAALQLAMDVVLDRAGFASVRHQVSAERQGHGTQGVDPTVRTPATVPNEEPSEAGVEAAPPIEPKRKPPETAVQSPFSTPLSDAELGQLDPQEYVRKLRRKVLANHLRDEDVRRQVLLIDATLGLIAKKVQSGELRVQVSDIPQLIKARALLTGLPTEQVAVAGQVQVQHTHTHEVVQESARLAEARKRGGPALLTAMQDEVTELATILQAVPRAQVIDVPSEKAQ
jgi:hypothetical protein